MTYDLFINTFFVQTTGNFGIIKLVSFYHTSLKKLKWFFKYFYCIITMPTKYENNLQSQVKDKGRQNHKVFSAGISIFGD